MITNPNPITLPPVPAIPQREADGIWIQSITITAQSPTSKVIASVKVCPFVSSTGEMLQDQSRYMTIPDMEAAAQSDPKVAAAMGAVYAVVQGLVDAAAAAAAPAAPPANSQ